MKRFLSGLLSLALGLLPVSSTAADGLIGTDQALAAAQRGEMLIIDVRTPGEWRQTGIATGAKTADVMTSQGAAAFVAAVSAVVGADRTRPLAVICRSGNRSARARDILLAHGFTSVLDIKEGMTGWLGRGLPVTPCPDC